MIFILNLSYNTKKAFPSTNIPPKQLKEVVDIVAKPLQKYAKKYGMKRF